MPTYSAFTSKPSGLPDATVSWTMELVSEVESRGTLVVQGRYDGLQANDTVTIGGVSYRVTNRSYDKSGTSEATQFVLRNLSYELQFITTKQQYVWLTAPEYIANTERIANIQQPVKTQLFVKSGDVFGRGGWRMSEICAQVAALGGWGCSYELPDFQVKHIMLDRTTSLLDFLRSALAQFMPRIYIEAGTLHIAPLKSTVGVVATVTVLETLSHSVTRQENYSNFRVTGGESEFRTDKWEGGTISWLIGNKTLQMWMGDFLGYVETESQEGYRTYYSVISDTHSVTVVSTMYSKDLFRNDQVLLFKESWTFLRKRPFLIVTKQDLETALAEMREYAVEETTVPPAWPDPTDFYLDSCDRVVNVYEGIAKEWEQPLLIRTYHVLWKYLWWNAGEISQAAGNLPAGAPNTYKNPPEPSIMPPDDSPFGNAFPPGYDLVLLGTPEAGFFITMRGVWNTDAYGEWTFYKYQYAGDEAEQYDVLGGLLLERNYFAYGVVAPALPNMQKYTSSASGEVWTYKDEGDRQRYVPAYTMSIQNALQAAYPIKDAIMKLRSEVESYRQVSLWVAMKTLTTTELRYDPNAYFFETAPTLSVTNSGTITTKETQYDVRTLAEKLPLREVPQTLIRKRAMQVYKEYTGEAGARRWAEVSLPLIVDWTDMDLVAPVIKAIHPQVNNIVSTVITTPEPINLSMTMFGGEVAVTLPSGISMGNNMRIVSGSVHFVGDGTVFTQLAIQGEVTI